MRYIILEIKIIMIPKAINASPPTNLMPRNSGMMKKLTTIHLVLKAKWFLLITNIKCLQLIRKLLSLSSCNLLLQTCIQELKTMNMSTIFSPIQDLNTMKSTPWTELILEEIGHCIFKNNGIWMKQSKPKTTVK